MILTLLAIATAVSVTGQFADAYTTYVNVHIKKNAVESNKLAFVQWLVNKHPYLDIAFKAIFGATPGVIGFLVSSPYVQASAISASVVAAVFGWIAAYRNYKVN